MHPGIRDTNSTHIGIIAQDVQKQFPDLVTLQKNGYFTLDYTHLTAVLAEGIKELSSKVDNLASRIEDIFTKYLDQQQQINSLKSLVCLDHPDATVCK